MEAGRIQRDTQKIVDSERGYHMSSLYNTWKSYFVDSRIMRYHVDIVSAHYGKFGMYLQ